MLRYLSSAYIKHEQILFFVHFHFANHPVLTNFEKVNFLTPQLWRQCYLPLLFWDYIRKTNGLHSLSSGVDDILFKKHGRWKTDHVKDDYEKENILDRFSVIKNLRIETFLFIFYFI